MSLFLFGGTESEEEKCLIEIISIHPEFKKMIRYLCKNSSWSKST